MYQPIHVTNTIPLVRNSISRSPLRRGFLLIAVALAGFALSPMAQAVSPPPDGGYPGANTAEGDNALLNLTTGGNNTAIGNAALKSNTTGGQNTANGALALEYNNADNNTANGFAALELNTTGSNNTANGAYALGNNTTGNDNTANGYQALYHNNADNNTANGDRALYNNTAGTQNTATGADALYYNATGNYNTANGLGALKSNTTGSNNTAHGLNALFNNTTGGGNIALGVSAGLNLTTGSNNIDIGNTGVASDAKKIRIGTRLTHTNTYIAGISGVTVAGGVGVIIDTNGHLGTVVSSERFKDEIKPMDKASEAILALQPVTFRYKHELDPDGIPQFGLVAEEVEKVSPDLVARDAQGKPYSVRYEAVNAMLLNEFLKEHRKVEEQECKLSAQDRKEQEQEATIANLKSALTKQEATIAEQQRGFESKIAHQQEQIEALTAGLQRVSAQVAMSRPAPQMALNNQ
jgi:hypothetical protein